MSHNDRSRWDGTELENLQRWRMHLTGEFREILEEVEALQTEPFADHSNARQREKVLKRVSRTVWICGRR
jgi:hypothetical protein